MLVPFPSYLVPLQLKKAKVLFVGSFKPEDAAGYAGGQMYACTTIVESDLSNEVEWVKIDSTATTNRYRPLVVRTLLAAGRIVRFGYELVRHKPDSTILFCSWGKSFLEKGVMARLANLTSTQVILAPRSGLIMNDVNRSDRFRRYVTATLNSVDVLLCQGESWEAYYRSLAENEQLKYAVIHNWIDPAAYTYRPWKRPTVGKFNLVFMGWVTKNKGVFDLLRAMRMLHNEGIILTLAGDGDAYEELKQKVINDGLTEVFRMPGWVHAEEKEQLLLEADALILPSYREGYPNVLLEAMATGLPVIATRVGSIPDLIQHNHNGLLVEAGEVDEIVTAIRQLKADAELGNRLQLAARQTIFDNNDVQRAIKKFRALLLPSANQQR